MLYLIMGRRFFMRPKALWVLIELPGFIFMGQERTLWFLIELPGLGSLDRIEIRIVGGRPGAGGGDAESVRRLGVRDVNGTDIIRIRVCICLEGLRFDRIESGHSISDPYSIYIRIRIMKVGYILCRCLSLI
jgi:hypothetical protein